MSKLLDVGLKDKDGSVVKLDLSADTNNSVLIVGTTGSGKTHFLKKILGEIDPDAALFAFVWDGQEEDIGSILKCNQIIIDDTVPEFGDRVMFNAKVASESSRQSTIDLLGKVWDRINTLPRDTEKFVVIDMPSRIVNTESFEQLLRMGRKLNVKVLLTMQNFEQVDDDKLELLQNFGNVVIQWLHDGDRDRIIKSGVADKEDFVENKRSGVIITPDGKTIVDFS